LSRKSMFFSQFSKLTAALLFISIFSSFSFAQDDKDKNKKQKKDNQPKVRTMTIPISIFTKRELDKVQSGVGEVLRPSGRIKKLEANLQFSDTFNNRIMLADAYLEKGFTDKAIDLYESSLTGNFTENEYVQSKLIIAYDKKKQYEKIIPLGKKLLGLPQFARSRSHIMYAVALGYAGNLQEAENEFLKMKSKFAHYEARYQFGKFLLRQNRQNEAQQLFSDMVNESPHLTPRERRYNREWLHLSKSELQKLESLAKA